MILVRRGDCRMMKSVTFPILGALVIAALIVGGTGSAIAAEFFFGNSTSVPSGCATNAVGGDEGFVCNNGLTFTTGATTLTATGFSDAFNTATALTWKGETIPTSNGVDERGLGENLHGPTNTTGTNTQACTDNAGAGNSTPCEIGINASVLVKSTTALMDVVVGSVQGPERFEVFTATTIGGTLIQLGGAGHVFTSANCPSFDGTGLCTFDNLPAGTVEVGVVDLASSPAGSASDVLLTAVSPVPAPSIGHGLLVVLAVGGVLFGGKLLESLKKHHLHAA
jgi:hypothetical protein